MKKIKRLPDAELVVMQALWDTGKSAYRTEIEERLDPKRKMAQTTLLTLLSRLEGKRFVRVEKDGRNNLYTPLINKEDYLASESRTLIEKLCGGNMSVFATALNDSGLSKAELEELKSLLKDGMKK